MSSIKRPIKLSVVIPAYNAGLWLPQSVPKVAQAIKNAHISQAEIIVVDDGSSDDTVAVARTLKVPYPLQVVSQKNSGRFLARCKGVEVAHYDYVLFIDTRIFIGENALQYITDRLDVEADTLVWTSHVMIEKKGNPYARFWEAITFISWRKYFANPRDCSYGIKDFDYYPKGTTCFFVPKKIILEANNWFKKNTKNTKASNDDTLLIRHIAEDHSINLSPHFFCTYHARTDLRQYSKHVYHRGKVFVDGFLRRDGNRFFWPLIGFLVLSVAVPVYLIVFPQYIVTAFVLLAIVWVLEFFTALFLKVPANDALSLFGLSPLFALLYGFGIWSAVFDIYVRRNRTA
ncbi:MAG TPA: glycosyltransferase family 2 protein [Candidatus Saccharimonadales bacterium]|nr:glycosyltransferase family 2 protein [Candidatus Saccharimonadales bacterium]